VEITLKVLGNVASLRAPASVAALRRSLEAIRARSGDDRCVEDKLTSEWMPACASPPTTWLFSIGRRRARRH
jgi:hypothetical protein